MKKYCIYIAALICIGNFSASAQEFKTDESIATQLKNGTVPGTKISAEVVEKKQNDAEDPKKISTPVKQQLMNGTYPGLVVTKSPATTSAPSTETKKTALPSNSKTAPAAPASKEQPVIPSQEPPKAATDN